LPDIFSYDLIEALGQPGCPLCRALSLDDRRWVDSFWREGKQDPGARTRFFEAGGFCRHHAWLLHHLVAAEGSGAAIADVYGWLATYDLRWLDRIKTSLEGRQRRRRSAVLKRRRPCPACFARDEAVKRKVHFFVDYLREPPVQEVYTNSQGLCFIHLAAVVEHALAADAPELALFLLDDWRRRLVEVRLELAEFDRKRDYRYASEPKGAEQRSWTEAIRLYVGEDFTRIG